QPRRHAREVRELRVDRGTLGETRDRRRHRIAVAGARSRPLSPVRIVDLRSDTLTRPTAAMRRALAAAEGGDDVFHEDPTVQALEARAAELAGKDAALFVPSGTMANLIACKLHTQPGDEVILERGSHLYRYEAGGFAAVAGVSVATLDGERGLL